MIESNVARAMEIAADPESMTEAEVSELLDKAAAEITRARRRQVNPGEYALLWANGMPWRDVVAEISGDATLVAFLDMELE